jgi:hypothetical protein
VFRVSSEILARTKGEPQKIKTEQKKLPDTQRQQHPSITIMAKASPEDLKALFDTQRG